ncbi:anaerobic ribonucleoside-triphosphate reductase-activating protein [Vibrio diazotrophicus]|uniref:Anaerobic ribonucleoside-triphosphate reductase-activating protein n=1 Tax=Vibrio diazotrophicus TaxID=685 RepID=A0ABX4W5J0_VIBDI|nr:anaerobic ribonucleoside-triphosphate reductase-activating protein [Vibrio diazotrophicus]PNH97880.1 anaerobic ribonucleotide reductase-activating protein [Vibrio diazotrophicus]
MNYAMYYDVDVVNGPGTRCTLFVSGCELACKGCYNKAMQSLSFGQLFTDEVANKIISDLNDTRIRRRGLSILGGDPLHPNNIQDVLNFVTRVRQEAPGKDIWCWTGYTLGTLTEEQKEVIKHIDVLVDGPFQQDLYNPSLKWRGSSNQIIHQITDDI